MISNPIIFIDNFLCFFINDSNFTPINFETCFGSNAKKLGDKSYPFEAEGRRQKAGGNKR
jgi:hypothetical protein